MKILCLGAHPDDLEVGMGGTIAKYTAHKHDVRMVVLTIPNIKDKQERLLEAQKGSKILGAKLIFLDIPSEEMKHDRKLIGKIEEQINNFSPDIIYTHWIHDSHQDHYATGRATISATRKNQQSVYMYEQMIPGGITPESFQANMFIEINEYIETKIEALRQHKTQITRLNPEETWIYGIKGRSQFRGYQINKKYAEAFQVIKNIQEIR